MAGASSRSELEQNAPATAEASLNLRAKPFVEVQPTGCSLPAAAGNPACRPTLTSGLDEPPAKSGILFVVFLRLGRYGKLCHDGVTEDTGL